MKLVYQNIKNGIAKGNSWKIKLLVMENYKNIQNFLFFINHTTCLSISMHNELHFGLQYT